MKRAKERMQDIDDTITFLQLPGANTAAPCRRRSAAAADGSAPARGGGGACTRRSRGARGSRRPRRCPLRSTLRRESPRPRSIRFAAVAELSEHSARPVADCRH